jgi:D-threo-aldose 1-dehydrogenase
VASFVAGTRTFKQLEQNLSWFSHPIPAAFWAELKDTGLLREDAPTPTSGDALQRLRRQ